MLQAITNGIIAVYCNQNYFKLMFIPAIFCLIFSDDN